MKQLLMVHQNFPGQYRYLAQHYAKDPNWQVFAIGERACVQRQWHQVPEGITVFGYHMPSDTVAGVSPRVKDFTQHVARADALEEVLLRQRQQGLNPDVILVHPGWGEGMYLREIFPKARIIAFCEFYFSQSHNALGVDREFPLTCQRLIHYRMANLAGMVALDAADVGVTPTRWQYESYPTIYRTKLQVIHDGVDTRQVVRDQAQRLVLERTSIGQVTLHRDEEIISYCVRNLEPSRRFHRYMRALPALQRARPRARFVIVGGDEQSYSGKHPSGRSWREVMLDEVGEQLDLQRVIFVGKLRYDDLLRLFSMTHLHIYMTAPFVLSWSLLEAMACQAPILASDIAPVREVITSGEQGVLVDDNSPEAIVEQVTALLEQPDYLAQLGVQARQKIVAEYDLQKVCLPKQLALIEGC